MRLNGTNLENVLFEYFDQMKQLLSTQTWENILLDCTKNELFILLLLYRRTEVNMTQIADYIQTPLNTATGIVARMEKKQMVRRERSEEDKRVVTIRLSDKGRLQIQGVLKEFISYGQKILEALSPEEIELVGRILDKAVFILRNEQTREPKLPRRGIKKIIIE